MRYAAHQPNFCPWVGYFAKMVAADLFVILVYGLQLLGGQSYVSRSRFCGESKGLGCLSRQAASLAVLFGRAALGGCEMARTALEFAKQIR